MLYGISVFNEPYIMYIFTHAFKMSFKSLSNTFNQLNKKHKVVFFYFSPNSVFKPSHSKLSSLIKIYIDLDYKASFLDDNLNLNLRVIDTRSRVRLGRSESKPTSFGVLGLIIHTTVGSISSESHRKGKKNNLYHFSCQAHTTLRFGRATFYTHLILMPDHFQSLQYYLVEG